MTVRPQSYFSILQNNQERVINFRFHIINLEQFLVFKNRTVQVEKLPVSGCASTANPAYRNIVTVYTNLTPLDNFSLFSFL